MNTHFSDINEINLYNKFVLTNFTLDATVLTIKDTAIIANANRTTLGDLVNTIGWSTSDYITVAAGTQLTVFSTIHDEYGIVYYNNSFDIVGSDLIKSSEALLNVPSNALYFRVCGSNDFESFLINGFGITAYNQE